MSTIVSLPAPLPWVVTSSPVIGSVTPTYTALVAGSYVEVEASTISIQDQIGQRSTGSITVKSALGTRWGYGTQFLLFNESGVQVYGGYIAHDKAYRDNGVRQADLGWLYHDLTLMDNCYRADKRVVFKQYKNISAGAIVNDLYGSYLAAEGVILTAGSVASGPTINWVVWSGNKTVSDALTWLAQQSGYWWNIDTDGVLWFLPYGGVAAPFAIDGSNVDSMQEVSVDFGNDMLVNTQYVNGSVGQKGSLTNPLVETFKGDGARRTFTLGYRLNTLISATLNAVDITNTFGDKGSTGDSYYAAVDDPNITQDPAQTVLNSGDTLVITYIGQYPIRVSAQDSAAIAAQAARERVGTGIIESVLSDTKVRSLPAAFQMANGNLSHYGSDLDVLTFSTLDAGLMPGQLLSVSLSDYGLASSQMLIAGVTTSDQSDGLNIWFTVTAVGSTSATSWAVESAQWPTFWQNIMAQSSDPSDYTDAQDTSLALLSVSAFSHTPSFNVSQNIVAGAICGVSMLCGSWTCN